jgi:hypothetical protein
MTDIMDNKVTGGNVWDPYANRELSSKAKTGILTNVLFYISLLGILVSLGFLVRDIVISFTGIFSASVKNGNLNYVFYSGLDYILSSYSASLIFFFTIGLVTFSIKKWGSISNSSFAGLATIFAVGIFSFLYITCLLATSGISSGFLNNEVDAWVSGELGSNHQTFEDSQAKNVIHKEFLSYIYSDENDNFYYVSEDEKDNHKVVLTLKELEEKPTARELDTIYTER